MILKLFIIFVILVILTALLEKLSHRYGNISAVFVILCGIFLLISLGIIFTIILILII